MEGLNLQKQADQNQELGREGHEVPVPEDKVDTDYTWILEVQKDKMQLDLNKSLWRGHMNWKVENWYEESCAENGLEEHTMDLVTGYNRVAVDS